MLLAQDLSKSFPVGKGSKFKLNMKDSGAPVNVLIYTAAVGSKSVNIEYFMESEQSLIPIQMWQQFQVEVSAGSPAKVLKGFVQTKELKQPEEMGQEYLKGFNGVKVNDFLFSSKEELDKNKVADETVSVLAGKTKTTHYRTSNNGQTIDYWISDEAKPIGLVKLVSHSEKDPNQNYTLELVNLMNNVKAKIDPQGAVPLSALGKSLLAKPESIR